MQGFSMLSLFWQGSILSLVFSLNSQHIALNFTALAFIFVRLV